MNNSFEQLDFNPNFPIHIQRYNLNNFELHWHSYIEIFFTLSGSLIITANGFSFNLDEGDFCFLNSGSIHSICHNGQSNDMLLFQISTSKKSPFYKIGSLKFDYVHYLEDLKAHKVPLKQFQKILLSIYEEFKHKKDGYENIVLCLVNLLFGIFIRHQYLVPKNSEDELFSKNLDRLNVILEFIDEHYDEKLTLSDIAEKFHINYYYLSHFFKNISGVSFQEYITRIRLNKSLPLLFDNEKTITEVALESGFANTKAYTTAFKKKFSMQPSKYRSLDHNIDKSTDDLSYSILEDSSPSQEIELEDIEKLISTYSQVK